MAFSMSISIHPSRVGWDLVRSFPRPLPSYFNPPIPCGMGHPDLGRVIEENIFQSTHPVWDGTSQCLTCAQWRRFQSTHPVWDGTHNHVARSDFLLISIHPSRVGWDSYLRCRRTSTLHFNPPIPCGMGLIFCVVLYG